MHHPCNAGLHVGGSDLDAPAIFSEDPNRRKAITPNDTTHQIRFLPEVWDTKNLQQSRSLAADIDYSVIQVSWQTEQLCFTPTSVASVVSV